MKKKLTIRQWLAIISVGIFAFCGILLETSMNVTFPILMNEFSVSTAQVQWMTTGPLLAMGIVITMSSYFNKRFKGKNLFLVAGVIMITGMLMDVVATNFLFLLSGRFLQGVGVGIVMPMLYMIIMDEVPDSIIGFMMGIAGLIISSAPALGPTFGGAVVEVLNWRYQFILILPIIIIGTMIGYFTIRNKEVHRKEVCDFLGIFLIGLSFTSFMLGLSMLESNYIYVGVCGVVSVLSMAYFIYHEQRIKNPLIHFDIFKNYTYNRHLIGLVCMQMVTLGLGLLLPSYVQFVFNQSAASAGLLLLPGSIIGMGCAPLGGYLYDRIGAKLPIIFGVSSSVIGILLFVGMCFQLNSTMIIIIYSIYMFGMGIAYGNTITNALKQLSPHLVADGNGAIQTCVQMAGAMGTSIIAIILSLSQNVEDMAQTTLQGSFYSFSCLFVLVFISFSAQVLALKKRKPYTMTNV